jgi:hypothetical protein
MKYSLGDFISIGLLVVLLLQKNLIRQKIPVTESFSIIGIFWKPIKTKLPQSSQTLLNRSIFCQSISLFCLLNAPATNFLCLGY